MFICRERSGYEDLRRDGKLHDPTTPPLMKINTACAGILTGRNLHMALTVWYVYRWHFDFKD